MVTILGQGTQFILGIINLFFNLTFLVLAILTWLALYFYVLRYKIPVTIHEQAGNSIVKWHTKAGLINNRKRGRKELWILKNKWLPFFKFNRWERPIPESKTYHLTKKGKKTLHFLKIGEMSDDLRPLLPPSIEGLKPVDQRIHAWVAQGLEKDARETRNEPDKLQKWTMIGVPMILIGVLVFGFIYGLTTVKDLQQGQQVIGGQMVKISEQNSEQLRQIRGAQVVPSGVGNRTDPANNILRRAGIDLDE